MAVLTTPENLLGLTSLKGRRGLALRRYKALENNRSSWRSHWMELSDYLLPRRGKFLLENSNQKGRKRNSKIIDSTGTQALRVMSAGMMTGMTSPGRPWFKFDLDTPDEDLKRRGDVKKYLQQCAEVVRAILHKSNAYNTLPTLYEELGGFGTSPLYRQKNHKSVIRFRNFSAGEYVIAENDEGVVDTLGRHFTMTVSQIYQKFVYDPYTRQENWRGVSHATKRLWNSKNFDALVPTIHLIEPREMAYRKIGSPGQMNMPFRSLYFEEGGDGDEVLQEGGYARFPAYVPRWDVLGGDIYGRSPGMDTLPDIKQLQHEQKRKAQALDKLVNPPMVASVQLRGKPTSVLPGANTYVDPTQGGQGFAPAYQVAPKLQEMLLDIQEIQQRIQRGFFADLFAMMINSDRRQITATEVVERHEEKLVLLGPVLQRLNVELLDPMLDDIFEFADEAGLLPVAPAAIEGMELKVEYISLLAQAQQAVAASAIERTYGFAGNLSAVAPTVMDNLDHDAAIREYSEIVGAPASILIDPAQVEEQRRADAEEYAAAQAIEQGSQVAQGAKVLSEADSRSPNALTDLLGGADA